MKHLLSYLLLFAVTTTFVMSCSEDTTGGSVYEPTVDLTKTDSLLYFKYDGDSLGMTSLFIDDVDSLDNIVLADSVNAAASVEIVSIQKESSILAYFADETINWCELVQEGKTINFKILSKNSEAIMRSAVVVVDAGDADVNFLTNRFVISQLPASDAPYLVASKKNIEFENAVGLSATSTITTNQLTDSLVVANDNEAEFEVSVDGNKVVVKTLTYNSSSATPKTATITVSAGDASAEIKVSQACHQAAEVSFSSDDFVVNAGGNADSIYMENYPEKVAVVDVETNQPANTVKVEVDKPDYFDIDYVGNKIFIQTLKVNYTADAVVGKVSVTAGSEGNSETKDFYVSQSNDVVFSVNSTSAISFSYASGGKSVVLVTENNQEDFQVRIENDTDSHFNVERIEGTDSIVVSTIAENEGQESIPAKLVIEPVSGGAAIEASKIEIDLSQSVFKVYTVGDTYTCTDDGVTGVVFEASADGKELKIVYPQSASKVITLEAQCLYGGDALDADDGYANTMAMSNYPNYSETNYPAIGWALGLGKDWYIPSMNEYKTLTALFFTTHNNFNQDFYDALVAAGDSTLGTTNGYVHFSSTEPADGTSSNGSTCNSATHVSMCRRGTHYFYLVKYSANTAYRVRAIKKIVFN